jgi:hypothetical protein
MPTPKMYVLVRNDLSSTYKLVQGYHALSQYAMEHPSLFQEWNNTTICVLGIRNLIEMKMWQAKLLPKKVISYFYEPDLDGQITAIACYDTGEIFKDLSMA